MKNDVFTFLPALGDRSATARLRGELTLPNAEAIRLAFRKVMTDVVPLRIEIIEVEAFDFAFVQLLLSVQHSARMMAKPLTWQLSLKEEFDVLLARSGLKEYLDAS